MHEKRLDNRAPVEQGRHYGIDSLRILAMLMVLILHIMGTGGVLGGVEEVPLVRYSAAWFLEICAYCAVNCYAMISGYIGVNSKYKYSSLAMLWIQVVLYMALGNVLWYFLFPGSVSIKMIIKSFLPIRENQYWYFTAYFCMFFFVPLLKRAVKTLNKKQASVICALIVLIFCALEIFIRNDNFKPIQLNSGYSVLWLSLLYFVGGCIRQHALLKNVPGIWLLVGYLLCAVIALACKLFIRFTDIAVIRDNISSDILAQYTSPTIFLCSLFLLVLFSKYPRLPRFLEKVVSVLAPASFGVYIIHAQPKVYNFFFDGVFRPLANWNAVAMLSGVLLAAVGIYLACTLIDTLRSWLFDKLRLKQALVRLEKKLIGDLWEQ